MWRWIQLKCHPLILRCIISPQFSLSVLPSFDFVDFISICVDGLEYTWAGSERSCISQNLKTDTNYWRWINYSSKSPHSSDGAGRRNKRIPRSTIEFPWQQPFGGKNPHTHPQWLLFQRWIISWTNCQRVRSKGEPPVWEVKTTGQAVEKDLILNVFGDIKESHRLERWKVHVLHIHLVISTSYIQYFLKIKLKWSWILNPVKRDSWSFDKTSWFLAATPAAMVGGLSIAL